MLYHSHVHKSAEEDAQQQEEIVEKERLKSERRREQVVLIMLEEALAVSCPWVGSCRYEPESYLCYSQGYGPLIPAFPQLMPSRRFSPEVLLCDSRTLDLWQ